MLVDFDGTVFDTSEGIINCVQYAQQKLGVPLFPELSDYRKFIGPPLIYSFTHFLRIVSRRWRKGLCLL